MTETTDSPGRVDGRESPDPPWLDRERYPFESQWFDAAPGRVHYVDEGTGDHAVVALHGNPTWSFMYRRLARALTPEYRVIAPDYLGFGLSAAPEAFSYCPEDHARVVGDLLDSVDAAELTLLVHDWGGPIGLSYAVENPDCIRSLVVCNTFCWPPAGATMWLFSRLLGGPLGRVACERWNAFPRVVMPLAFANRERFPRAIRSQYVEPLDRRTGTWVFPRELLGAAEWLASLWDRRAAFADVPALLAWGMEDPAFGRDALERFRTVFDDVRTARFENVGHYVPEEGGSAFADQVTAFLDGNR